MSLVVGPGELRDPVLQGIEFLTGAGAAPMLDAAAGAVGAQAEEFAISQISHDPARSCTVTYTGRWHWADGRSTDETVVAATSIDGPLPGAAVLVAEPDTGAEFEVGVWRYPFDPALPGLAATVIPELATERFGDLVGHPVVPTVVSYRPGRRAVVRLDGPSGRTAWAKVLRPSRSARLVEVHRAAVSAGLPVPETLVHHDGVVVLSHLTGTTLRDRLLVGRPVPDPLQLAPLLARLGALPLDDRPARRRPLADVAAHVESLVATLPDQTPRLRRLLELLETERRGDPEAVGAGGVVHGDLHDAQLLCTDGDRVSGLLDLDDVGRGDRADDLGNLIAHGATMATALGAVHGRPSLEWCDATGSLVDRLGVDPREVARRAAAAALSLATGPLRACEPRWRARTLDRLALAEALLEGRPDRGGSPAREKSLRGHSRSAHPHAGEKEPSNDVNGTSTTGGTR